ncbi:hypothetical protein COLO4_00918 [Corchorus olitorius]|uniref:Uncharacterized protein n=1 Tax=Corchorus olitorius TaxID=93759 RepID=A0A1R3L388_9ROSI|nr:hypothetical protein COLO4_00918 [Corchorus olitorius]
MQTYRLQHDINRFQELIAVQVVQHCQVDARAALGHFSAQAVEPFFQHQREVYRQVGIAGGHVAFGFDNAGIQQAFLLVGEHAVTAILYRLAAPPRADLMQNALILFADRKACAGTVRQIVNLFLNPGDGIFREDRRGAHFACLVTNDQLIVFDPDGALREMMCQRQRATHRDRFIHMLLVHFSVVLRALGTDRRLHDMHQGHFVRFNALAEGVEIQGSHRFILVRSRGRVRLAEQGVFVHAQRVIRQKMNIIDAKFIGGEVGNGGYGRFIGIEALNQRIDVFQVGEKQIDRVRQLRVHKRLAAGKRNTAAAAVVKGLIAQHGRHDLAHLLFFTAYGQRLRRAAVGEGVERLFTQFFTVDDETIQRAFDTARRRLLTQVAAVKAQARIKQHVPATGTAFRVLAPATAQRAAFQEHHGTNTGAIVGGVTLNIEDHVFTLKLHMKIK